MVLKKPKKLPRTVVLAKRQVGKSVKKRDVKRKALTPGLRKSKSGKYYYESRKNRSDKKGKKV